MSVAEELRHRARLALLRARRGKTTDVNPRVRSVSVEKASWWSQRLGVPVAPGTPTAALPKTAEIDDVLSLEPRQREAYLRLRQAGGSHERAMRDARGLGGDTPTPAKATPAKAAPRKAAAASAEQRQRQAREWARRYERGESISQIAVSEGVSYSTVHSRLTKDAGIQLRPRGARKATPAKAAPAKATPAAAAPAASGLSSDPEVRAAQVRNSIIEAYHQLRGEERSGWVSLARLRDRLSPELSREEVDQALRTLFRRPGISMVPEVGNRDERLSAAAIRIGGEDRHLISIDSRRLDDVPEGTPRAPAVVGDRSVVTPQGSRPTGEPPRTPEYGREVENAIRDAYSQLLARRNREVGDWVSIAEIREVLGDRYPREDVDNALARLNRQSGVNMVPEFDQTVLSREQRTGAIVLGGQSRHLIAFESSALRDRASAQQWSLDDLTPSQRLDVLDLSVEGRRVYEQRRDAGISHDLALRDARQVAPRARGEESARDVRDRLERQWGYRPSASQVLQRVSDDELRRLLFDDRERESLGISVNDISQEQSSRSAGAQQLRDFGVEAFDPAREGAPRPTGRGERGSVVQFPRRTTPATAGSGGGEVTDLSDYRRALAQGLSPRDAAAYAAWARRNPGGSIAQWRAQRQGPISQEDFILELDNKGLSARRLRQLAESVGLEPPTWVRSQAELTLWLAQNRDHPGLREAIAALPGPRRSAGFVEASDLAMALTRLPDEQAIVRRLTEIGANVSQLRRVARELNIGIPETPPSGSRWTAAALRQHLARIIVRDRGRFSWR